MGKLPRVVVVNDYARVNGGASRVAVSTAAALAQRGHEVHFFAAIGPVDESLTQSGVTVTLHEREPYTRSRGLAGSITGLWDRSSASAFREVLGHFDPVDTVVHLHTFRIALSASVPATGIELGFPTLYTAHEYTLGCPYGGFYNYRHAHACALHGLSARCVLTACSESAYVKKLWWVGNQAVYRNVAGLPRKFSRVFFVSAQSQAILQAYTGSAVRQEVLRNPIEIDRAPVAPIPEDAPFLFLGALVAFKDPITLARAARIADVPVAFAGEGPLASAVTSENSAVEMLGWLSDDAVATAIRRSRAIVLPSLGFETFGLSVAEGAACGRGGIVSEICVASEPILQSGSGVAFKSGDPEDLALKLSSFTVTKAEAFGHRAYDAYWSDPPTMTKHLDQLVRAYEEELGLSRAT